MLLVWSLGNWKNVAAITRVDRTMGDPVIERDVCSVNASSHRCLWGIQVEVSGRLLNASLSSGKSSRLKMHIGNHQLRTACI